MSNFMKQWNQAIQEAHDSGTCGTIYKQDHMLADKKLVARTMHPSFMGTRPAKYDPKRDK
jgi:hypothetical protein